MFPKSIIFVILLLALVTMACGIQVDMPDITIPEVNIPEIDIPVEEIEVGPTQTEEIFIPFPAAEDANLNIGFGAGELKLSPGAEEALVEGTASYNVQDFQPTITQDGNNIELKTGKLEIKGVPRISGANVKNDWELKLGSMPMDLTIDAGAYRGEFELGRLALQSLEVSDGASDVDLVFSAPNQVPMSQFRYNTGASNVQISGLANANFSSMTFRSGAGNYRLDFSGVLQRDATVNVESGISQVVIVVPAGTSARVQVSSSLTNITARGVWDQAGDEYVLEGDGPTLTIYVTMGAGSLELRNVP
jgi:hypothetical protein